MCVDAVGSFESDDNCLQYDVKDRSLEDLCSQIMLATSHRVYQSNQAKPLCNNKHLAKYAVINRTNAEISCYLCEFHGCPFEALTYQTKALLPHQYILDLVYLKNKK